MFKDNPIWDNGFFSQLLPLCAKALESCNIICNDIILQGGAKCNYFLNQIINAFLVKLVFRDNQITAEFVDGLECFVCKGVN